MRKPKPKKRAYKKRKTLKVTATSSELKVGDKITFTDYTNLKDAMNKIYSPAPVLTLCGQLEDSVMLLENRISNVIAKINSLM